MLNYFKHIYPSRHFGKYRQISVEIEAGVSKHFWVHFMVQSKKWLNLWWKFIEVQMFAVTAAGKRACLDGSY